jgi:hypothetical protein
MKQPGDSSAESFAQHEDVVILAVNGYESADFATLDGPVNNARRLAQVLIDKNGCAIPESRVLWLDETSSAASFCSAIKARAERASNASYSARATG